MRQTVVPGIWSWSRWQADRNLDFNGFFVESDEGNLVVDPIDPDDALLAELTQRGVAAVVVTNRDHERGSAAVAAATGARVLAPTLDAPELVRPPDATLAPGDVVHGWRVLGFSGLKTPGEIALIDPVRRAAIVGDAIWGTPAGALTLMPDAKLADPAAAALSLRALRKPVLHHLLVGDGDCVFGNARAALDAMFAARVGVAAFRANVDELAYALVPGEPPPFLSLGAELGRLIGSSRLESAVWKLPHGTHTCPYHWHTAEEELLVVLAGTPTLRSPQGTFALRRGDVVAFPTNEHGAHRLWNDGAEDALLLIVANSDTADVCFYPDSEKLMVEVTNTLVRSRPQLDYFDGER
jgi:uncharacterized cupin superfamily protein